MYSHTVHHIARRWHGIHSDPVDDCLAAILAALEAEKASAEAAADLLAFTTATDVHRLSGHALSRSGLVNCRGQSSHLLSLRLHCFLGRHDE